ncbi:MAG TPA: VOC family protein [Candidatus Binataceae bacterium]|nr:VOC family protein [Candidatus Binataceae bacterium]
MEVKELGHIVLYVGELERSRSFYRELLGWREIAHGSGAAAFSSGRTHHELLLIEVGPHASPIPPRPRVGLYHFGLKVGESDDELRAAIARLREAGVPIVGMSDHGVTHSVYLLDPDGNEIEIYIDVQPPVWRENPAEVHMYTRPLRI